MNPSIVLGCVLAAVVLFEYFRLFSEASRATKELDDEKFKTGLYERQVKELSKERSELQAKLIAALEAKMPPPPKRK